MAPTHGCRDIAVVAFYIHHVSIITMAANTSIAALRAVMRVPKSMPTRAVIAAQPFHTGLTVRKDPPLKGPVPIEAKDESQEGGDGFLGVSGSSLSPFVI